MENSSRTRTQCDSFIENFHSRREYRHNERLLLQAPAPDFANELSPLPPATTWNARPRFTLGINLRPAGLWIEDRNVATAGELKFFPEVLLEIQAVGACRLKPGRSDEVRDQHAVNHVTEIVGFNGIANFERINSVVAAHSAPLTHGSASISRSSWLKVAVHEEPLSRSSLAKIFPNGAP